MNRFNCGLVRSCRTHARRNGYCAEGKISFEAFWQHREEVPASFVHPDQGGNVSLSTPAFRENFQRVLRTLPAAVIVLLPAALFAQGYFGTVSGILTDPSSAAIQGAKVTLLDEQKGYKFTTTSNNEGQYLFVSIPPGLYSVTAEKPGFQKTERTHVKLSISENPTANLTLKVASASQSVDVRAQGESIDTQDAVTGQVVDRRLINDLPLIDRNVQDLIYLAPGVTDQSDANSVMDTNGTNFISNGTRER